MPLVYPEWSFQYSVHAVYYWPYRDDQVTSDRGYRLRRGEHRYFRYNVSSANLHDVVQQAGAAGVWARNVTCYEVPGGHLCEGFLEPKYEGVTLGALAEKLFATALEVSLHPAGFVEEAIMDLDDYLTMDYHTLHPVQIAAETDILYPGQYYPATAQYRGVKPGTLSQAPPPDVVAEILRNKKMGFYQPYGDVSKDSVTFILRVGPTATTPKQLAELLNADAVVVNLQTLSKASQDLLRNEYDGATPTEKLIRFFDTAADKAQKALDTTVTVLKYTAITAAVLGIAWLGLKAYPDVKEAVAAARK